jgi:hypothetical protein
VAVSKGLDGQEHADFEEYKHPSNMDEMYWLYTETKVESNKTAEALAAHAARNGDTNTQPCHALYAVIAEHASCRAVCLLSLDLPSSSSYLGLPPVCVGQRNSYSRCHSLLQQSHVVLDTAYLRISNLVWVAFQRHVESHRSGATASAIAGDSACNELSSASRQHAVCAHWSL